MLLVLRGNRGFQQFLDVLVNAPLGCRERKCCEGKSERMDTTERGETQAKMKGKAVDETSEQRYSEGSRGDM